MIPAYAPALRLDCAVRGTELPPHVAGTLPIGDRIGIDVNPLAPDDPEAVAWLRSCAWPEQVARLARPDAALTEAATVRPRQVAGDMVESPPAVLSTVDDRHLPRVFSSNAVVYLPEPERRRLVGALAAVGARHDLAVLLNEASRGAELFTGEPVPEAAPPDVTTGPLTLVSRRDGRASVEVLARTGPHGDWLE